MNHLPYAVAAWLFLVGLYAVVSSRNLIHLRICVGVIQSSSYVLLLAISRRVMSCCSPSVTKPAELRPSLADIPASTPAVDPVMQALMLTAAPAT